MLSTNHSFSSDSKDAGYQRLELLLIGFATVFITFLWVGVFSAVLQNRSVRVPFAGNGAVAAITRNLTDHATLTMKGMLDGGTMAKDTVIYQFIAIWESSCVTQKGCLGGLQMISQKASSAVSVVDNIATNSKLFVSVVRDVSSFRIGQAGDHMMQLVLPGRAYASDVLGEKTILVQEVLSKGIAEYYQYLDSMTFGLVTAINPALVSE